MVTPEAWLLASWVLVGAALLVTHVWALLSALRSKRLSVGLRLIALIPPATPVMAFIGGRRRAAVLWVVLLVTYIVLRLMR